MTPYHMVTHTRLGYVVPRELAWSYKAIGLPTSGVSLTAWLSLAHTCVPHILTILDPSGMHCGLAKVVRITCTAMYNIAA